MQTVKPKIIAIVGPTASGKTDLAHFLALRFDGELVSADSRQVYKQLDIGTGKEGQLLESGIRNQELREKYPYLRYLNNIPQWLTDITDPTEKFTVADYQR